MYASAVCFTGNSLFAAGKLEQHGKAAQASPQRCEVAFAGRMSETALDVFSAAAAAASVAFCSCSCAERHPLSTLDAHQPSGCGGGPLIKWSHQKAAACAGRAAGPGVVGAQMLTRLLAAVHSPSLGMRWLARCHQALSCWQSSVTCWPGSCVCMHAYAMGISRQQVNSEKQVRGNGCSPSLVQASW